MPAEVELPTVTTSTWENLMEYRYQHFKRQLLFEDMAWRAGPRPGEPMPDFDLPTTEGGRLRKRDFVGVKPLLLTFGSVTLPDDRGRRSAPQASASALW